MLMIQGRRKHEKKHCPNFGKYAQPRLRGRGRGAGLNLIGSFFVKHIALRDNE